MTKEEQIELLKKQLAELEGTEEVVSNSKTEDFVEDYIRVLLPSHLGKVGEFDFGDDKCLVFHSVAGGSERLKFMWLKNGKVNINDIELPQSQVFESSPVDGNQLKISPIKQMRIEKGIENIKEWLKQN